ncbi:DNA mismatch repair protein MutS [Clostridium sp. D2Q-14]|uniref:MutS-related protein n=1 Tax=Anaeromonas gelatinilytica TaxID=2683194 RepID=UPI00193C7073|nr:DNA mismatch repair protein MutS [Anaeromonas gelatinilytica]MBS4536145.1 DNA mismatch repair protein MutS [Anaeromonas gelatinilytica]
MIQRIKNIFIKKQKIVYNVNRKRNFKLIKSFFDKFKEKDKYINDSTWNDLNMDDVYCKVDRTLTTPGEQKLYEIMRIPLINKEELKDRENIISYFDDNKEFRDRVHEELYKISRVNDNVIYVLKDRLEDNLKLKILYNFFAVFSVISIISIFIVPGIRHLTIPIFAFISITNMLLHYGANKNIGEKIEVIEYTGNMINVSRNLIKITENNLHNYNVLFEKAYDKLKSIGKKSGIISRVEGLDVFADYINTLFLVRERNYFSIVDNVKKYSEKIIELYNLIGEIDAYIAISVYRETLDIYTIPEFYNKKKVLEVEEIIHPLLENPVSNSISFENGGMVLTGSNMSGKSTFLRTIGVNAILAQTINTVLAKRYKTSFYNVVSSISLKDNIGEGKSFYFAEAEAILRMINSSSKDITTLALIDEIFKGTNPVERINAAAEILNFLQENNAFTIVATHDLNLIPLINNYVRYYFMENMTDEGMIFDYKLRKGISPTRNAVKILRYINYPEELLERIDKRLISVENKTI